MAETEHPTSSGWRGRALRAKARRATKNSPERAAIREARARHRQGLEPAGNVPPPAKPREGDGAIVAETYPDAEAMKRHDMMAYLRAHGVAFDAKARNEDLREQVRAVRDGEA